jgi:glycosyltransferase involved in cell wall biosynthesis
LGFLVSEYQLRFADAVIAVTPALAERLERRGIKGNVHVIANAADPLPEVADAKAPEGPYVLSVGRVTAQKNVANLVRGYEIYAGDAKRPPKLVVAGGLDETDYVEALKPLLTERTVLAGRITRSAMGPLYRAADVYINASLHEGSSNAVLEAIAAGCPILLSDIPENRDFRLAPEAYFNPDDPQAIADALKRAMDNPDAYRVDPQRYLTWQDVAARTIDSYRQIAPPRRARLARGAAVSAAS